MTFAPGRFTILLVDDQREPLDLLARRLQKDGYHVAVADNGATALDCMRLERYDLLLLDLQMPGLDGLETLRRKQSDPATRDVPVIMLTACGDRDMVARCVADGAADYVVKPVAFLELKMRMRRVLERWHPGDGHGGLPQVLTGRSVMLVDDEALSRDMIGRRLAQIGCTPVPVVDGREARAHFDRAPVDAVLLDLNMPGEDGYRVLQWIRAETRFQNVPVLMLSATNDSDSMARCLDAGADDYLTKPVSIEILKARLSACLASAERRRAQDLYTERLKRLSEEGARLGLPTRAGNAGTRER